VESDDIARTEHYQMGGDLNKAPAAMLQDVHDHVQRMTDVFSSDSSAAKISDEPLVQSKEVRKHLLIYTMPPLFFRTPNDSRAP
jgi:hypothetical protein